MTDQEQLRVLIADDDAGMRTVMRKIIAKVQGFTLVAEAGDGKTALELTEQIKPNVVFLDVEMPEIAAWNAPAPYRIWIPLSLSFSLRRTIPIWAMLLRCTPLTTW